MVYTGRFKDINDVGYFIKITTDDEDTTTKELILGTPPITVSYECGESIIYKPIKYSSATITVATDNIYNDMYSGKNQGTSIKLYNSQRTLWVGYITPNVYNQTYSGVIENLEIECIDALSTLKNIDYTTINENKDIVSFKEIFCHILKKCNAYTNLYFINEVIDKDLSFLYISENNFFDEDDEPMKCSEVLEETLKYLNMTMFADGLNVYIIDYDAISKDYNNYIAYNINDGTLQGTHKIGGMKTINGDSFMGGDGDLSIDNVYNKASVVAEMYDTGNIIEEILNDEKLNVEFENTLNVYTGEKRITPNDEDINKNTELFPLHYAICSHQNVVSHYWIRLPNVGIRETADNSILTDYTSFSTFIGATLYKYALEDNSVGANEMEEDGYIMPIQSKLDYKNCILFHLNNTLNKNDFDNFHYYRRLIDIRPSRTNVIADDNTYLLFKVNSIWRDAPQRYFTGDEYKGDLSLEIRKWFAYWNDMPSLFFNIFNLNFSKVLDIDDDATTSWSDEKITNSGGDVNKIKPYQMPFYLKNTLVDGNESYNKDSVFDNDISLYNNVHYTMGIDDEGYLLKLPQGTNINEIIISFYQPYLPYYSVDEELHTIFVENFEIKVVSKNEDYKDNEEEETNTTYENVLEENFVEELSEISFKVNTYDKKISHSSVYTKNENDENFEYVDTIENKALNQKLRQEEMLIYRIVQQYKTPHYKLNFQLKNDFAMYHKIIYPSQEENKNFVIDTMAIDYENNTSQITLIEKA